MLAIRVCLFVCLLACFSVCYTKNNLKCYIFSVIVWVRVSLERLLLVINVSQMCRKHDLASCLLALETG